MLEESSRDEGANKEGSGKQHKDRVERKRLREILLTKSHSKEPAVPSKSQHHNHSLEIGMECEHSFEGSLILALSS